jgi:putative sterol carrier protein
MTMTSPSADFFDDLHRRGHEPLLAGAKGTVRVDLVDGHRVERRIVTIERGDLSVSSREAKADCRLRADRALFDDVVRGHANALACVLRGAIDVEGDWGLLLLFQRLFPSPPRDARPAREGGKAS